jgi:1,4-dihydroxy-6-naphthoate synthase
MMPTPVVPAVRLYFSPCPNDTFIFHAWVHGLVPDAPAVSVVLADIDELNAATLRGEPDVAKVSFSAFAQLCGRYALLHAGGALGRGCGPLLVAREGSWVLGQGDRVDPAELAAVRIAIPGRSTTAALLLRLFAPAATDLVVMPFDRIMPAVASGEVQAGVIIHESRFTYPSYGLRQVVDLGEWWESTTGMPIPLGGIVVRRDKGPELAAAVDRAIRLSLEAARRDPMASAAYVRAHAQEMDAAVCRRHIDLYVNEFSLGYGAEGEDAIRMLLAVAQRHGIAPDSEGLGVFWDDEDPRGSAID